MHYISGPVTKFGPGLNQSGGQSRPVLPVCILCGYKYVWSHPQLQTTEISRGEGSRSRRQVALHIPQYTKTYHTPKIKFYG